jgi:hypothetical protein
LPQYWPKQFFKKLCCLGLLSWAIIFSSYSQDNLDSQIQTTPGILESLIEIIGIEKNQYTKLISESEKKSLLITDESQVKEIKLDPFYVKSLLLNSDNKYLTFLGDGEDECRLISLFQNDLLKTSRGIINRVIVNYIDNTGARKRGLLTKNNFLEIYFKKKCITNRETQNLFSLKSLETTLKNTNLPTPKTQAQCTQILKDWVDNPHSPYLCGIHEKIQRGLKAKSVLPATSSVQRRRRFELQRRINEAKKYTPKVPYFQRTYLSNLCSHISDERKFCDKYLAKDVWSKIVTGERPDYLIEYKCKNVLNKKLLTKSDIKKCALKFKTEPNFCKKNGNRKHAALFPLPNCNEISDALTSSKLVTKYHDCPGSVDNEGVINIHRIINHFNAKHIPSDEFTCASATNLSFAKLNFESNNSKGWPLKICYKNLATEKKECSPYVPGISTGEKYSEDTVISNIIKKVERTPFEVKCKLANSKRYNTNRLGYKSGCFIVFDPENCTTMHCPKKVYFETKLIDYLKYEGKILFDYFPTSFSNEKYAATNLLSETYKKQSKKIRNYTELKFYFNTFKEGIIHGIGCAEDLFPGKFNRNKLNQCRPLPFIIDGVDKKNLGKLIFRSAINDLHSPVLLEWNIIFNSVANYKELHPLNTWTLYGIR